jgi:arylsulfatase A-like enzyme
MHPAVSLLLRSLVAALALLLVGFAQAADRPNILFIMSDDHGYQAMSCYGSKVNQTPNLDRIAKAGMRFDRCYVTNSICGPSRAVILTGKYSHLNGFATNGDRFNGKQQTVASLLQAAGYETAVIGKWHLGTTPVGFTYHHVLVGQGPYYNPRMLTSDGPVQHTGYTTDIITDQTLAWLRERRDKAKPFFLMYHHKAPHRHWMPAERHLHNYDDVTLPEPDTLFDDYRGRGSAAKKQAMTIARHLTDNDLKLTPQTELNDEQRKAWDAAYGPANEEFRRADLKGADLVRWKYQRYAKDYLRCVDAVDENVGRVLDYLDESGLAENTVVFYTSDQGWYLGEHGWYDKRWMYEESFRTPLLVRWPGKAKPGSTCEAMAMNLDFAPTFLEIAGQPVPDDMQGASLAPLLAGETPPDWRRSMYYHYYEFPGPHSVQKHYGVRTDRHKLIHFYELGEWELYDLENDPQEMKSIYGDAAQASVVEDLKRELERLRAHYKDDGAVAKFPDSN